MTSNLAQSEIAKNGAYLQRATSKTRQNGHVTTSDTAESPMKDFEQTILYPILKRHFGRDEFLGRINETLIFLPFTKEELFQFAQKELERWAGKAAKRHNIVITWDEDVVEMLCKGYNVNYGARSIKHECDRVIVNVLARAYEQDVIRPGSNVKLVCGENGVTFQVR